MLGVVGVVAIQIAALLAETAVAAQAQIQQTGRELLEQLILEAVAVAVLVATVPHLQLGAQAVLGLSLFLREVQQFQPRDRQLLQQAAATQSTNLHPAEQLRFKP